MTMQDYEELCRNANEKRDEFNDACRKLYYTYEHHRILHNENSTIVIEQVFAECRVAELAYESAKKDLHECYEREAMISTYKEN